MMKNKLLVGFSAAALLLGTGSNSNALDFDFFGTFTQDNDVLLFDFTVGAPSTVTIFSSSWDDGGFDPILAVWNASGSLINEQDDGGIDGSTLSNAVLYDHGVWDSYYAVSLATGSYQASVAQYDNFAFGASLSNGFTQDGNPNFTFDQGFGGATQPFFNGVDGSPDPRTGDWAFHILNVAAADVGPIDPVPEPATMLLIGTGLAGIVGSRIRRKK